MRLVKLLVRAAKNEIIALIDSNNILDGTDWIDKMVQPFKDKEIVFWEKKLIAENNPEYNKNKVWFMHPVFCWITLIVYASGKEMDSKNASKTV